MPTVAPLDLDGHCLAAGFLGDVPFFCAADGTIHRLDHGHKRETVHDGLLCAAFDATAGRLLTGGEDGKVAITKADGSFLIAADAGKKWVTSVAAGPQEALAWAIGRTAFCRLPDGKVKEFSHPRSVEGLAFAPKGMRFAVARYNGATLHFPAAIEGAQIEHQFENGLLIIHLRKQAANKNAA